MNAGGSLNPSSIALTLGGGVLAVLGSGGTVTLGNATFNAGGSGLSVTGGALPAARWT